MINQELTDQMNLVQLSELMQFSQLMIVSITDRTLITSGSKKILQNKNTNVPFPDIKN